MPTTIQSPTRKDVRLTIGGHTYSQDLVGRVPICVLFPDGDYAEYMDGIAQTALENFQAVCDLDFLVRFEPCFLSEKYDVDREHLIPLQVLHDKLNLPSFNHFTITKENWPAEQEERLKNNLHQLEALIQKARPSDPVAAIERWEENLAREIRALTLAKPARRSPRTKPPTAVEEKGKSKNPLPLLEKILALKRAGTLWTNPPCDQCTASILLRLQAGLSPKLLPLLNREEHPNGLPVRSALVLLSLPHFIQEEVVKMVAEQGKKLTGPELKKVADQIAVPNPVEGPADRPPEKSRLVTVPHKAVRKALDSAETVIQKLPLPPDTIPKIADLKRDAANTIIRLAEFLALLEKIS